MRRFAKALPGILCLLCFMLLTPFLSACALSYGKDSPGEATTELERNAGEEEEKNTAEAGEPDELEIIRFRIDKIKEKAETEAPKADRTKINEAANYIKDHYNDCYESPGSMEHMIYYGYLLFSRFEDGSTIGDMGHSGATAAELVYCQEEMADSPTVKAYKEDVEACILDLKEEEEEKK